jgi:hypothetical protein
MTRILFLLSFSSMLLTLLGCQSGLNDESIKGTWKVSKVEIVPLHENFTEKITKKAEERMMSFTYTFLENDNLKTLDGDRNIEKGGDFILDEKRNVLTINESYNGIKITSVLWLIEESTSESMTLFLETPEKSTTRMTLIKVR